MKANKVPIANKPRPITATVKPTPLLIIDINTKPPIITNIDIREATLTTGTNVDRIVNQL